MFLTGQCFRQYVSAKPKKSANGIRTIVDIHAYRIAYVRRYRSMHSLHLRIKRTPKVMLHG